MIFLVVIAFIAIVVILLNFKDSSNLEKIENYLKAQNCKSIVYSKGTYKGVCENKIIEVSNGFSVDLEKDKKVLEFANVNSLEKKNLNIIINKTYIIEFKENKNIEKFYKNLKEKIN